MRKTLSILSAIVDAFLLVCTAAAVGAALCGPTVVFGHDDGTHADESQAVRDWYKNAELTPEAQKLFNFKSCCAHSDVVKTKFKVSRDTGADEWWYLDSDNQWQRVPDAIIHWGESAPDGQPTMFAIGSMPTCFWPGESGN